MNTILEIALGLALVYLLVCLLVSGIQEVVALRLGTRGRFLVEGMRSLITDRWTYLRTINHPSIVAFYRYAPGKGHAPPYLPPNAVAEALCDVLVRYHQMQSPGGGRVVFDLAAIKAAVRNSKECDSSLGHALLPLVEGANTLEEALASVARWVERGMDQVTRWYGAHTQKRLFVIGLVVAATLNIDSIAIVEALVRNPSLRTELATAATQVERYQAEVDRLRAVPAAGQMGQSPEARQEDQAAVLKARQEQLAETRARLNVLAAQGLPIGYACMGSTVQTPCWPIDVASWPLKIAGLLLTALAAMLGAPFWFDLINRFVNLRASGAKSSPLSTSPN